VIDAVLDYLRLISNIVYYKNQSDDFCEERMSYKIACASGKNIIVVDNKGEIPPFTW
jgi:hypothetical protein